MTHKTDFVPPKNKNDLTNVLASVIRNKRISVFIDSANLYYAASVAHLKIDYFQIAKWFQSKCDLTGLNFYTAFDPADQKQQEFFEDLEKVGYRIIKKPIKVFEGSIKGNMDIELAVDALLQKDNYDVLILVSGDSDFRYLVQALDTAGKQTVILGIGGFTSYELHQEADNYFFLNRIIGVWQKQARSRSRNAPSMPAKLSHSTDTADTTLRELQVDTKAIASEVSESKRGTQSGKTTSTSARNSNSSNTSGTKAMTAKTEAKTIDRLKVKLRVKSNPGPQIFAD